MIYKATTRQELANKAGVCLATFKKWLKTDLKEIKKLGYKERVLLPPAVVRYLSEKYVIEL